MPLILNRQQVKDAVAGVDLVAAMERAFVAYSAEQAVVPAVGELLFADPPGDVHIKYGYLRGDYCYVIKVASGFYENPALGLPASNGLMLLHSQSTGELLAVLLDEGYLTDLRTAAAGALAARYLAPECVARIGIIGTGVQAELQLRLLHRECACRQVLVCGRSELSLQNYRQRLADSAFSIETTLDPAAIAQQCDLIVTTTPASTPWLASVRPGTHITAVGSDTADKQELASEILAAADLVVVDSRSQALSRGEVFRARANGLLDDSPVPELGEIVAGTSAGRSDDQQITVADLTGVATQDIEIARAVYERTKDAD